MISKSRSNLSLLALSIALVMFFPGVSSLASSDTGSTVPETELKVATFAGGCFWCVESDFDTVAGVVRTVSGYTGGHLPDPTYGDVTSGKSGHREAVQIYYDPRRTSYSKLLEIFWRSVNPTDEGGQFCDRGESYTTAIFANTQLQRQLAEASKRELARSGVLKQPIVTSVEVAKKFYPAESYHQDYYQKNPLRYKFYRYSCGRDEQLKDLWGDQALLGISSH